MFSGNRSEEKKSDLLVFVPLFRFLHSIFLMEVMLKANLNQIKPLNDGEKLHFEHVESGECAKCEKEIVEMMVFFQH